MIYEESLWEKLKRATKPILVYGMGDGADKLFEVCERKGIRISGVFASDEYVREKTFHSFPVTTYAAAKEAFGEMIILLAFAAFREELMAKILALSEENELYAPSLPLFGEELFDAEYFARNRARIEAVPPLLADDFSRRVYCNLIQFRLSGKISYLLEIQTERDEIYKSLLPSSDSDHFLDLGAYDGDTALEFNAARQGKYGSITAFEPNRKIFPRLESNTAPLHDCSLYCNAAWDCEEELSFNGKTGRSAAIDPKGSAAIRAIAPDSVCKRASIIKMDVEGAEARAIRGCENLIRNCHPALWISAYHRTEDLFTLPEKVLKIAPYRIYLRHFPYIPDWDTMYFFI